MQKYQWQDDSKKYFKLLCTGDLGKSPVGYLLCDSEKSQDQRPGKGLIYDF